jgi:DNA repair protein RecO (recombination protein O)
MAGQHTSLVFVLRKVEYAERDIIATLFARDRGRFSAIAKNARGSKRRFGGGIQPLRLLRADYTLRSNSDLARLDSIDVREDFQGIEGDFDKIAFGSYATEWTRELTVDADPRPDLFDLLGRFYRRVDNADSDPLLLEVALRHFQLQFFRALGSPPSLDACVRCEAPLASMEKVYALRSGEGVICPDCVRTGEGVGVVFPETLELLRYFRAPEGRPPDALREPDALAQARRMIDATASQFLNRQLKSRPTLDASLTDPGDLT